MLFLRLGFDIARTEVSRKGAKLAKFFLWFERRIAAETDETNRWCGRVFSGEERRLKPTAAHGTAPLQSKAQ
jgi:hypothetical protein